MKETIVVLGMTAYQFPDEQTGEMREGAHIHYVGDYAQNEANKKGTLPIKMAAKLELYEGAKDGIYPAICELESKTIPDAKGKPMLTPVKLHYGQPADVFAPLTVAAATSGK